VTYVAPVVKREICETYIEMGRFREDGSGGQLVKPPVRLGDEIAIFKKMRWHKCHGGTNVLVGEMAGGTKVALA
jgi:hypothetical protein